MSESNLLNANIVPRPPCEYGIHPETALEEDITKIMRGFGIKRVFSNSLMTEHQVFDMLQFPQHSPVRNNTNVVYANVEQNSEQHLMGSCDEVSLLHEKRFGYKRDLEKAKRVMFVSHTTAITIEHLMQKVETIYTISKTYRNKKERREKTHVELVLIDQSLPEIITFMQTLYSLLLQQMVELGITSDFYYFCEPSFSFHMSQGGRDLPMGSGGYVREELFQIITRNTLVKPNSIALIVLPFQKILNMRIGEDPLDYDLDYNSI